MLPTGTAYTGPESLEISVAIGPSSFLPSCPVTRTLQTQRYNKLRKACRGRTCERAIGMIVVKEN